MHNSVPLAAAVLLTLATTTPAGAQLPGVGWAGAGGAYRSPFPPTRWGGPAAPAWRPGFAPGFAPGPPAWGPRPVAPGFPPLPPPGPAVPVTPTFVPPGQAHIARPDPFGPPVKIEPRAEEASVGGVTARRYDYSFDVSPLPGTGFNGAAAFPGEVGAW